MASRLHFKGSQPLQVTKTKLTFKLYKMNIQQFKIESAKLRLDKKNAFNNFMNNRTSLNLLIYKAASKRLREYIKN